MNVNEFDRLVRMKELKLLVGLSNSSIYSLINLNRFPKPIHLSERSVAWKISTVNAWVEERMTNESNK
jgi:prophage regulatory protein